MKLKKCNVKLRSKVVVKNMKNKEKRQRKHLFTILFMFVNVDFNFDLKSQNIKVTCMYLLLTKVDFDVYFPKLIAIPQTEDHFYCIKSMMFGRKTTVENELSSCGESITKESSFSSHL